MFRFGEGDGQDIITDFTAGETIQVDPDGSAQSITQVGTDVLVQFSSRDWITIQNSKIATVQAGLVFGAAVNENFDREAPGTYHPRGFGGNDTITGNAGDDRLAGDSGANTIDGGAGNDFLFSGGISPLVGSGKTILLDHGVEKDTLKGGDGDDIISAGYGDNVDGGANGTSGDTLYISFMGASAGLSFLRLCSTRR